MRDTRIRSAKKKPHENLESNDCHGHDDMGTGLGQASKPKTLDDLVAYTGPDRQKIILEGAKE